MQTLSRLTNQELNHKIQSSVREERRVTVEVLRLLREIERRMVYAELGYPSLFSYCTGELGYSEAATSRRIEAMRGMRESVEVEQKIESGELSLSAVSQARVAIRAYEREAKVKVSNEQKTSVMLQLSGLSRRVAEKVLLSELPISVSARPIPERQLSTGGTRLTLDLSEEEMAVINELSRFQGKAQNAKDLLMNLARKELAKKKRERGEVPLIRKAESKSNLGLSSKSNSDFVPNSLQESIGNSTTPPAENGKAPTLDEPTRTKWPPAEKSRHFSANLKRLAWQKANGQCEFVSPERHRCEARHRLEFDHRKPVALGGESHADNIRLLCREHNLFQAVQNLGTPTIARYVPKLETYYVRSPR